MDDRARCTLGRMLVRKKRSGDVWKIFERARGAGPWACEACDNLVYERGKRSNDGVIHHKDEDTMNNDISNFAIMHFGCHRRFHMLGTTASLSHRKGISDALTGHEVTQDTRRKIGDANRGRTGGAIGDRLTCECGLNTFIGPLTRHTKAKNHVLRSASGGET
jgi:hypothetical protein